MFWTMLPGRMPEEIDDRQEPDDPGREDAHPHIGHGQERADEPGAGVDTAAMAPVWIVLNSVQPKRNPSQGEKALSI